DDDAARDSHSQQLRIWGSPWWVMSFGLACNCDVKHMQMLDVGEDGVSNGLRELLRVFGLLMGLSWEACFVTAVEDISEGHTKHQRTFIISGITLALGLVVVPAWALYILPKVLEAEEEEEARRNEVEEAYVYQGAVE
ncbi:unnamed protein product, partial [Prorocentrum cordatum]